MDTSLSEVLTSIERSRLAELESKIEAGLQTFVDVGLALLEIRDNKLYRETNRTFEGYCREQWGFSRNYANKIIAAAEVVENLGTIVPILPATESQARPLAQLEPVTQREVWQQAVDTAPNGKVTAAHVESVARRFIPLAAPDEDDQYLDGLTEEPNGYDWAEEPDAPDKMAVHYSSDKMDWETPQELFDLLDAEFNFTIDVCATPETAKCLAFFTPEDDGLAQDWRDHIGWMNPPYGDEIPDWVAKAYEESRKGAIMVCLVPARVDTSWWWNNCIHGEIRFLKGRIKFKQNGNQESGAPFPSAVVVFSPTIKPKTVWWDWKRNVRF
jgi:DNA N-6-adenine-methyltransferase (Dam).